MNAPLPEVFVRNVDDAFLDELFRQVGRDAEGVAVRIREPGAREARADEANEANGGATSLDAARRALAAGSAIQLRYRIDGAEWFDTLAPSRGGGVRLIRCAPFERGT